MFRRDTGHMPDALTTFLWIASVCIVILTVLWAAVAAVLIYTALKARLVVRRAQQEVEWLAERRKQLWYRARFATKWLSIMGRRLTRDY